MLAIERLEVSIGETPILREVALEVSAAEIVAILGPSGSGKSTLLRAIAGLIEVESGSVTWAGESVVDTPTHQRRFGLMFQGYALFPHLDVARNVAFGLEMQGADDTEAAVARALDWVGLNGFGDRAIDSLSGGERQRVALARTLAPEPRLVMLDEPLGALDRRLRDRLLVETRSLLLTREAPAIVVTHDRDEAVEMTDRLALMSGGTIVQTGTLDELLARPVNDWVAEFLS